MDIIINFIITGIIGYIIYFSFITFDNFLTKDRND